MKILILFFVLYHGAICAEIRLSLYGWEIDKLTDHETTYKKNDQFKTVVVVKEATIKGFDHLSKDQFNDEIKGIEKRRKEMLSYFGIRDYQIDKHQFIKENDSTLLAYRGSYRGISGKRVAFVEFSIVKDKKNVQLTLTQERESEVDRKLQNEILSCMKGPETCRL